MHKQCSPNFEHYRWNKFLKYYCSRKTHLADSVEFTRLPSKVKQAEEVPKAVNFTSYCLRRRTLNTIQGGLNEQLCTPVIFFFGRFSCMNCFYQPKKIDFWATFFAKYMFHRHDLFAHHFAINNDDIYIYKFAVLRSV